MKDPHIYTHMDGWYLKFVYTFTIWFIIVPKIGLCKKAGFIDDVTTVYLQQTQGIGLSIHLNELLHYSMAHYMACV